MKQPRTIKRAAVERTERRTPDLSVNSIIKKVLNDLKERPLVNSLKTQRTKRKNFFDIKFSSAKSFDVKRLKQIRDLLKQQDLKTLDVSSTTTLRGGEQKTVVTFRVQLIKRLDRGQRNRQAMRRVLAFVGDA